MIKNKEGQNLGAVHTHTHMYILLKKKIKA